MEFISAEEFLKQPKEVQEVFFKWANDNVSDYDLVQDNGEIMLYKDFIKRGNVEFDSYPLFVEGQLRKFIEDKTNGKVESYYAWDYYTIAIRDTECGGDDPQYDTEETDLLQAYWKVACEIAKESVENE
jgi:hypothetical protein